MSNIKAAVEQDIKKKEQSIGRQLLEAVENQDLKKFKELIEGLKKTSYSSYNKTEISCVLHELCSQVRTLLSHAKQNDLKEEEKKSGKEKYSIKLEMLKTINDLYNGDYLIVDVEEGCCALSAKTNSSYSPLLSTKTISKLPSVPRDLSSTTTVFPASTNNTRCSFLNP